MSTPDLTSTRADAQRARERDATRTFTGYRNPNMGAAVPSIPHVTDTSNWTFVEGEYAGNPDVPTLAAHVEALADEVERLRAMLRLREDAP